jgi:hypothetical protein
MLLEGTLASRYSPFQCNLCQTDLLYSEITPISEARRYA